MGGIDKNVPSTRAHFPVAFSSPPTTPARLFPLHSAPRPPCPQHKNFSSFSSPRPQHKNFSPPFPRVPCVPCAPWVLLPTRPTHPGGKSRGRMRPLLWRAAGEKAIYARLLPDTKSPTPQSPTPQSPTPQSPAPHRRHPTAGTPILPPFTHPRRLARYLQ